MPEVLIDEHVFDIDGIVFDKDGTLIDFQSTWAPILKQAVDQLIEPYNNKQILYRNIYNTLGVDYQTQAAVDGPYACASLDSIYLIVTTVLFQHGLNWTQAQSRVEKIFKPAIQLATAHSVVTSRTELPKLFSTLQNRQIQVGIATADNRAATLHTLSQLHCEIDRLFIACGDDFNLPKKPDPGLLENIAKHWGTCVKRIAMVGDTIGDVYMAQQAGAVSIGVLSGAGTREQLQQHSQIVIDSIELITVL